MKGSGGGTVSRVSREATGKQPGDKGAGGGRGAQLRGRAGPRARVGTSACQGHCSSELVPPTRTPARTPPPSAWHSPGHTRHVDATSLRSAVDLAPAWI